MATAPTISGLQIACTSYVNSVVSAVSSGYAALASANTFTTTNIFNNNTVGSPQITVSNFASPYTRTMSMIANCSTALWNDLTVAGDTMLTWNDARGPGGRNAMAGLVIGPSFYGMSFGMRIAPDGSINMGQNLTVVANATVSGLTNVSGGVGTHANHMSLTTSPNRLFTYVSGHSLLTISGTGGSYWIGYLFWTSNLTTFTSVPISTNNIVITVNTSTFDLFAATVSGTSIIVWNLLLLNTPTYDGYNFYGNY